MLFMGSLLRTSWTKTRTVQKLLIQMKFTGNPCCYVNGRCTIVAIHNGLSSVYVNAAWDLAANSATPYFFVPSFIFFILIFLFYEQFPKHATCACGLKIHKDNLTNHIRLQSAHPAPEPAYRIKGGATLGAGRDMSPPLLRDVPRRGYNPIYVVHLWGTTAGR